MAIKKTLNIYTSTYPYGWGESYLDDELPILLREFDQINIYPLNFKAETHRTLLKNVFVKAIPIKNMGIVFQQEFEIFRIMLFEFSRSNNPMSYIRNWRMQRSLLKKAIYLADFINSEKKGTEYHYSFWMNDWALALAVLKNRKQISSFFFRVNGFDIYDERNELGFIPFRQFIYKNCEKVYTVSKVACDYLIKKYGYANKIEPSHFGTTDFGLASLEPNSPFRILSCARVIPLKNVVQIARAISKLDIPIEWMHHGEGEDMDKVFEVVKTFSSNKKFLHSKFTDSHEDSLVRQKEFEPNVFISLSSTEGLPVTLINAISMGLPIIATDVGGCREVVQEGIGLLLKFPPTDEEVKLSLEKTMKMEWNSMEKRKFIRHFWLTNFSAEIRYSDFSQKILKLS